MSRGEEAAHYIKSLIFDGELTPGSRVPQEDIAHVLGISRIPVREALIAMEREGWISIELNRGAFVNALDTSAVRDHYALFGMIYGFAVRRALARTPATELLPPLKALVKELATTDDPARFLDLTLAFQRTIITAARSPRIKALTRTLVQLVTGDFFSLVPEAIELERRGLRAVTRALDKSDADKAAAAYEKMTDDIGEAVLALFERRGLVTADDDTSAAPEPAGEHNSSQGLHASR